MLKKIKAFFAMFMHARERSMVLEDPNRLSDEEAELLRSKHMGLDVPEDVNSTVVSLPESDEL